MSSSFKITLVIGNPSAVSRTKVLALALADAVGQALRAQAPAGLAERTVRTQVVEIAQLGAQLLTPPQQPNPPAELAAALQGIAQADLLIAATPVYKGSVTGLFKHLFDLVPPDSLVARPVLLAANGGSDRHALVVDHQLRPLFAFFRALSVPSAVYATEADSDGHVLRSPAQQQRIREAADQAAELLVAGAALQAPRSPAAELQAA